MNGMAELLQIFQAFADYRYIQQVLSLQLRFIENYRTSQEYNNHCKY